MPPTARALAGRHWRALLFGGLTALTLIFLLTASPTAAAAEQAGAETPRTAAAAADEFAVSDDDLAVAIFIPFIFIVASAGLVYWAWSNRRKDGDEADDDSETAGHE